LPHHTERNEFDRYKKFSLLRFLLQEIEKEIREMKKRLIATFMMIAMLAVMVPFTASTASAQTTRSYRSSNRTYTQRTYNQRVYKKPSFYSKHRNLINLGIGAGAGTIIGAIAGGKRGAALGALIGGGGAAVYTYGVKPKKKTHYYRRY
jgi:hypothetical protein